MWIYGLAVEVARRKSEVLLNGKHEHKRLRLFAASACLARNHPLAEGPFELLARDEKDWHISTHSVTTGLGSGGSHLRPCHKIKLVGLQFDSS